MRRFHWPPVDSPQKGRLCGAMMFSCLLACLLLFVIFSHVCREPTFTNSVFPSQGSSSVGD